MTTLAVLAVTLAGLVQGQVPAEKDVEADWVRQAQVRLPNAAPTPDADALGGCDGTINGLWGFHTINENQPWWQVDLGGLVSLDRIRLYNRCDAFANRAARFLLLLSDDGVAFRTVYEHDGTVFYGHTDSKPLEVALNGERSRYVRIQLPGADYLHLDEVQVFAAGTEQNVALGKVATQSSVSEWSVVHNTVEPASISIETVANRGRALAENLITLGANVQAEQARFEEAVTRTLETGSDMQARERAALDALWSIRAMALRNPLLDFDEILFVKRAPTLFPHISDQYYGWFSRGGGGLYVLPPQPPGDAGKIVRKGG